MLKDELCSAMINFEMKKGSNEKRYCALEKKLKEYASRGFGCVTLIIKQPIGDAIKNKFENEGVCVTIQRIMGSTDDYFHTTFSWNKKSGYLSACCEYSEDDNDDDSDGRRKRNGG